jgi:hypothetical protein
VVHKVIVGQHPNAIGSYRAVGGTLTLETTGTAWTGTGTDLRFEVVSDPNAAACAYEMSSATLTTL